MLHAFLNDVGQSCEDMFVRCHFEGRDRDCSSLFEPIITDEGQCCAFNVMPEAVMFRNNVVMVFHGVSGIYLCTWLLWIALHFYIA